MADYANLEKEVRARRIFSFYARKEFKKWKAKRAKLEILLEQAEGYTHSLVGDLEIRHDEVFYLQDELRHALEVKARGQLYSGAVGVRVELH